jgi:hypothetical protein
MHQLLIFIFSFAERLSLVILREFPCGRFQLLTGRSRTSSLATIRSQGRFLFRFLALTSPEQRMKWTGRS